MKRGWWSLRRWTHVLKRMPKLIFSKQVSVYDKLLFLIPVSLYWVLPDVLPLLPIDDIGVTLFAMHWFVDYVERKYAGLL